MFFCFFLPAPVLDLNVIFYDEVIYENQTHFHFYILFIIFMLWFFLMAVLDLFFLTDKYACFELHP